MNGRLVTLPNRELMLQRLIDVNDESHFQERFYPILLKQAGKEKFCQGVSLMLLLAIDDYTKGMPDMVKNVLHSMLPSFLEALLPDEEAVAEAMQWLEDS